MAKGILGRKVGMTQVFNESGEVVPVTVIEAGPRHVLQVRTADRDGYEGVQLGFLDKPRRLASRAERGHVAKLESKRSRNRQQSGAELPEKAGCEPKRFVREFRGPAGDLNVGDVVDSGAFAEVASVDVVGISKGRGTAGVMKRHNFSGQRATHGVKKCHRHLGGTGCSAYPSRVFKGKKMPGRYGNAKTTIRNLKVIRVDGENHLILVKGAVPGPRGGMLVIRETNAL